MLNNARDMTVWLIWLAVLPFIAFTAALFVYPDQTPRLILAELSYSAVALAFIGGSWWERSAQINGRSLWTLLALYPTLVGWCAQMIRMIPALWLLTISFLCIFLVELKHARPNRPITDNLCAASLIATICLQVMLWKLKSSGLY